MNHQPDQCHRIAPLRPTDQPAPAACVKALAEEHHRGLKERPPRKRRNLEQGHTEREREREGREREREERGERSD